MSSSNQVRITFITETVYGETPGVGNFKTVRFTSESLSGTPETTESQTIRTDRLSSGQVTTGLNVEGDINFELAKEDAFDELIESAMYSTFSPSAPVNADLTIVKATRTLTRAAGDWNADVKIGQILTLATFVNTENNTEVQVTAITSALIAVVAYPKDIVDEVKAGATFQVADEIEIGVTKKSFSMEKAFLDLATKAINYRGMIVSAMNLNVQWGEIVTGSFSLKGNDQEDVDAAVDFMTDGRTIDAPATTNSLNGSIDMPFIIEGSTGTLQPASYCINQVTLGLDNNLTAQTCIGKAEPNDYSEGTAAIATSINAYLSDDDWALLSKKITQESFPVGFMLKNGGGFYGFFMPAVQVSFEDPASAGINQDVFLNMSGVAKVGAAGEKSLSIYKG